MGRAINHFRVSSKRHAANVPEPGTGRIAARQKLCARVCAKRPRPLYVRHAVLSALQTQGSCTAQGKAFPCSAPMALAHLVKVTGECSDPLDLFGLQLLARDQVVLRSEGAGDLGAHTTELFDHGQSPKGH